MSAELYKRTVKWKRKKNKRLAKKKKKQEEDEFDEECTFQPKINKTYKLKNETKNVFNDPLWRTDKNYRLAIKEHCKYLGIDIVAYPDLMYIGREALFAELPAGWTMHADSEDNPFFENILTGEKQWEHPLDIKYREMYKTIVAKKQESARLESNDVLPKSPPDKRDRKHRGRRVKRKKDRLGNEEMYKGEKRIDMDGMPYTFAEFQQFYGMEMAQQKWSAAPSFSLQPKETRSNLNTTSNSPNEPTLLETIVDDETMEKVVQITIHRAEHLKKSDMFGKSDPYAVIYADNIKVGKTKVIKNSLFPVWDHVVDIKFDGSAPKLKVQIFDSDLGFSADDFHGQVILEERDVLRYSGQSLVKFSLLKDSTMSDKKNSLVSGAIYISFGECMTEKDFTKFRAASLIQNWFRVTMTKAKLVRDGMNKTQAMVVASTIAWGKQKKARVLNEAKKMLKLKEEAQKKGQPSYMRQTKSTSQTATFISQSSIVSNAHSTFRDDGKKITSPIQQAFWKKSPINKESTLNRQQNFKFKTKGQMVKEMREEKQIIDVEAELNAEKKIRHDLQSQVDALKTELAYVKEREIRRLDEYDKQMGEMQAKLKEQSERVGTTSVAQAKPFVSPLRESHKFVDTDERQIQREIMHPISTSPLKGGARSRGRSLLRNQEKYWRINVERQHAFKPLPAKSMLSEILSSATKQKVDTSIAHSMSSSLPTILPKRLRETYKHIMTGKGIQAKQDTTFSNKQAMFTTESVSRLSQPRNPLVRGRKSAKPEPWRSPAGKGSIKSIKMKLKSAKQKNQDDSTLKKGDTAATEDISKDVEGTAKKKPVKNKNNHLPSIVPDMEAFQSLLKEVRYMRDTLDKLKEQSNAPREIIPKSIIKKTSKVSTKDHKDTKTTKFLPRSKKTMNEQTKIKKNKPRVRFEVEQDKDMDQVNSSRPRTSRQKPTRLGIGPNKIMHKKKSETRKRVKEVESSAGTEEEEEWTMDAAMTNSLDSPLANEFISFSKSENDGDETDFVSIDLKNGRPGRFRSYSSEDETNLSDSPAIDFERQKDINSWQFENSNHFLDNSNEIYSVHTPTDRGTPIIDEILSSSFSTVDIDSCMKNNVTFDNQTFYQNTSGHQIVQQLQSFDDNNAFLQEWNTNMGDIEFETKVNNIETKFNAQTEKPKFQRQPSESKYNTAELNEKKKGTENENYLILTVHNCQQLKRADAFGKSDPYCIIFQDSYEIGRTPVINTTLDPEWNYEVEIALKEHNKYPEIILQVFDKDLIGEDNFHGLVYLPSHDVAKYMGEVNIAFTLNPDPHRNARGNAYVGGFMHVSFRQKYASKQKQNESKKKLTLLDKTKNMTPAQAWTFYSAGHPSFLTHSQMKRLFEYCLGFKISKETLDVFVESMSDQTNPRIVSKQAYDSFVNRGKQLSKALDRKKREEFCSRSPHHRILLIFFDKLPDLNDRKEGKRKKKKKKKKRGEAPVHRK